jgi:hypothetical protein
MGIGTFLLSGHARNARRIVPTKAGADPDGMDVRRMSAKNFVSANLSSLQRFAIAALD